MIITKQLKYVTFQWNEADEALYIKNAQNEEILLRRADIFPLFRFCLRIIQRYFVAGVVAYKKRGG